MTNDSILRAILVGAILGLLVVLWRLYRRKHAPVATPSRPLPAAGPPILLASHIAAAPLGARKVRLAGVESGPGTRAPPGAQFVRESTFSTRPPARDDGIDMVPAFLAYSMLSSGRAEVACAAAAISIDSGGGGDFGGGGAESSWSSDSGSSSSDSSSSDSSSSSGD